MLIYLCWEINITQHEMLDNPEKNEIYISEFDLELFLTSML